MQDSVPPEPWEPIKACVEEELGRPIEQLFATFDPTPLAAASLGQVHAATLADGQEVIVKVQRPNIERTSDVDLDILYDLARLAQNRTALGQTYDLVEIALCCGRVDAALGCSPGAAVEVVTGGSA